MSVCYLYSQRKVFSFKKHSILSLSSHCNLLCQHSLRRVCSAETIMPSVKYGFWIKKRVQGHIWRRPSYSQLNCFLSCAIYYVYIVVVDVESLSHVWLFVTPWTVPYHLSVLHHLLQFAQTPVHWVRDAIQPSHPLSSPSFPALNLSQHQSLFPSDLALHIRWPENWSFSIRPSTEYAGLISFRTNWSVPPVIFRESKIWLQSVFIQPFHQSLFLPVYLAFLRVIFLSFFLVQLCWWKILLDC